MTSSNFKIGDVVNVGSIGGLRREVIDIIKPLGTYERYKVMAFLDGQVLEAAKHELVKGLPDSEFQFLGTSTISTAATPEATSTCTASNEENVEGLEGVFDQDFWDNYDPAISVTPAIPATDTVAVQSVPAAKGTDLPPKPKPDTKKSKRKAAPIQVNSASAAAKRFVPMSEDDINDFVIDAENPNTKAKTMNHVRLLTDFLEQRGITTPWLDISAGELDKHIAAFFITVRQKNGSEYEPVSLRSMMSSFERHLRQNRYGKSIITDIEFDGARNALKSKQKKLKQDGYGNAPKNLDNVDPSRAIKPNIN